MRRRRRRRGKKNKEKEEDKLEVEKAEEWEEEVEEEDRVRDDGGDKIEHIYIRAMDREKLHFQLWWKAWGR